MRRHRRHLGDIFNHVAMTIFTHQPAPRLSGKLGIKAFLNPLNALVIDISKPQQVSRHVPRGIEAARLIAQVDPWQVQFVDPFGLLRVNLTGQIDEPHMRMALNAFGQFAQIEVQRLRHRLPARAIADAALLHNGLRVGPDSAHRHADRQRAVLAVADGSTLYIDGFFAQRTHIFLFHQVIWRNDLQPGYPPQQYSETPENCHAQQPKTKRGEMSN